MGLIRYLGSLIKTDTGNSSKSFTLVLSAIISFIAGLVMCAVIGYDGFKDGVIDTDLENAGIFMLCMGSFMAASGVPKIFGDRQRHKINGYGYDDDEYSGRRTMKSSSVVSEDV